MNTPQFDSRALAQFRKTCRAPVAQGSIGKAPTAFLRLLRGSGAKREIEVDPVEMRYPSVASRCCRQEVRRICADPKVDPLEAYAVAMSWGGQRKKHFEWSIKEPALLVLLNDLRSSNRIRAADFGGARQLARSISGLGLSYWAKLLFFFRPTTDAYILDQWTAKSMAILLPGVVPLNGELPSPRTSNDEYEAYCLAVERLAEELGGDWTSGDAEQALFDRKGGEWRKWVKSVLRRSENAAGGDVVSTCDSSDDPSDTGRKSIHQLLDAIAREHESSAGAGMPLPPGMLRRSISDPRRVRIGGERGERSSEIMWFYKATNNRVSVGVLFSSKVSHILDALIAGNDLAPWFGAGRTSVAPRMIVVDLPRSAGSSPKELSAIMVAAMSSLFSTVHGVARFAGIQHPKL